jgi:hypothetical protein
MFTFTIREMAMMTVIVALAAGAIVNYGGHARTIEMLKKQNRHLNDQLRIVQKRYLQLKHSAPIDPAIRDTAP